MPLRQSNLCCIELVMNMLCRHVESEKGREGNTVVAEDVSWRQRCVQRVHIYYLMSFGYVVV